MGCCTPDGICAQGTQDVACGTGGIACDNCVRSGLTCLFHTCGGGFETSDGG
jgi:hypothetical protein